MNIKKAVGLVFIFLIAMYFLLTNFKKSPENVVDILDSTEETISKTTDFVDIDVTYPTSTSLSGEAGIRAKESIKKFIVDRTDAFLNMVYTEMLTEQEKARLLESNRKYAMGIDYNAYTSTKYISYVFNIYEDTGGAHPNSYYATLNFNKNGEKVELADLFKNDARYLDRLSDLSYNFIIKEATKRFESTLDDDQIDWIRMGTAPTPETLQFYYVNGENLVLIFPPYQVSAYAAGTFEAKIPLSKISDILK